MPHCIVFLVFDYFQHIKAVNAAYSLSFAG